MAWPRSDFELWHGTDATSARDIFNNAVSSVNRQGRSHLYCDFGPGFYTTPDRFLAEQRAHNAARLPRRDGVPMLVRFTVNLDAFASLKKLAFASGGKSNEMFWWFVHSCREGAAHHDQVHQRFFPAVIGPIVSSTGDVNKSRTVMPHAEQVSFHGNDGFAFINAHLKSLETPAA